MSRVDERSTGAVWDDGADRCAHHVAESTRETSEFPALLRLGLGTKKHNSEHTSSS